MLKWFHHQGRWAAPVVYVRDSGAAYTRYTAIVDRDGPWRYTYTVHDGSVVGPILATGRAPWAWLARLLAARVVPS
jgi:hypothetical protein